MSSAKAKRARISARFAFAEAGAYERKNLFSMKSATATGIVQIEDRDIEGKRRIADDGDQGGIVFFAATKKHSGCAPPGAPRFSAVRFS